MNTGMKMLMVDSARRGGGKGGFGRSGERMGSNYARMGYDDAEGGYDGMESRRRRDSRGRFRSEMDGIENKTEMIGGGDRVGYERRSEMGYGEMRRGGSGGRSEMESRGGYGRSENAQNAYGEGGDRMEAGWYPNRPFPVYEGGDRMNQIGFSAGSEFPSNYSMDATYGESRTSYEHQPGYSYGMSNKLTKEMADEWMSSIENEDGTKGAHWTMEQAKQVMAQKGVKADPVEFYAVLNAMYADYCKVFKKHGVGDKLDFYVDMAKAFIEDKDAAEGKVAKYFEFIVKH